MNPDKKRLGIVNSPQERSTRKRPVRPERHLEEQALANPATIRNHEASVRFCAGMKRNVIISTRGYQRC
jgi:hypothetical protein